MLKITIQGSNLGGGLLGAREESGERLEGDERGEGCWREEEG